METCLIRALRAVACLFSSVDHDCVIGDGSHIGPGAHLAAEVVVGARAFVGTGAVVLPRLHIGDDAVVGAFVAHDVLAGATVVGNPAHAMSKLDPHGSRG